MKDIQDTILQRAKSSDNLGQRIGSYSGRQTLDLNEWIFSEVAAPCGGVVLELCSGTGMQTARLAMQVGGKGRVYALDASVNSLVKTMERCDGAGGSVIPLEADLDALDGALDGAGIGSQSLDMCFCAYGLYYAKDVPGVLDVVGSRLKSNGLLVIVGPFGANNRELFDLLTRNGVTIPEYVTYTCCDFMPGTVLPILVEGYSRVVVRTAANRVAWKSVEEVLSYWRSSTFYDERCEPAVTRELADHFAAHGEFVNHKRIMCVAASAHEHS